MAHCCRRTACGLGFQHAWHMVGRNGRECGLGTAGGDVRISISACPSRGPENDATKSKPMQDFPDVFDADYDAMSAAGRSNLRRKTAMIKTSSAGSSTMNCAGDRIGAAQMRLLTLFLHLRPTTPGRTRGTRRGCAGAIAISKFQHRLAHARAILGCVAGADAHRAALPRNPVYQRNAREEDAANRADPVRAAFFADCDEFAALRRIAISNDHRAPSERRIHIISCSAAALPMFRRGRGDRGRRAAYRRHLAQLLRSRCEPVIAAYAATGKPCLVGEFSFRSADSGLPNTNGSWTRGRDAGRAGRLLPALRHCSPAQSGDCRVSLVRACRPAGRGPLRWRKFKFRNGIDRGSMST